MTNKKPCLNNRGKRLEHRKNHDKPSVQNRENVIRHTKRRRSSRALTSRVSFHLSSDVYRLLKSSVPNVSGFLRKVVYEAVERLPVYFSMEEFQLEVEIARLTDELQKVHRWQSLLLKHGSYAQAYLEKLKGGWVQDRKPFYEREPPPFVKASEIITVEKIVEYREKLAKLLVVKLNRVIELKMSRSQACDRNKSPVVGRR